MCFDLLWFTYQTWWFSSSRHLKLTHPRHSRSLWLPWSWCTSAPWKMGVPNHGWMVTISWKKMDDNHGYPYDVGKCRKPPKYLWKSRCSVDPNPDIFGVNPHRWFTSGKTPTFVGALDQPTATGFRNHFMIEPNWGAVGKLEPGNMANFIFMVFSFRLSFHPNHPSVE